jgi:hypothetical protein
MVISGTGALSLQASTVAATGVLQPSATGALTLQPPTVDGTGAGGEFVPIIPPVGRRRRPLPEPESVTITGYGAIALSMPSIAGAGRNTGDDVFDLYLGVI